MFIVLLRFSENRSTAGQFVAAHNEWIQRGFDDGVFLLVGSLQPNVGGSIVAHNTTRPELGVRVSTDPFVTQNVVKAEILELSPSRAEARLAFLVT